MAISTELWPHQADALLALRHTVAQGVRRICVQSPTGSGKCVSFATPVLLYDGRVVQAKDIVAGDLLMGPDSRPRTVLSTCVGIGPMFDIVPTKGDTWGCNDVHVLTLVETQSGRVVDIPLDEYLRKSKTFKHTHKLFQPDGGVDFAVSEAPDIDPYFLGVWLGDGTKSLNGIQVTKPDREIADICEQVAVANGGYVSVVGRHRGCPTYSIVTPRGKDNPLLRRMRALMEGDCIPHSVLVAPREYRMQVLAGLIDTDGYVHCGYCEISQKRRSYADGIAFLARSLGFRVTMREKPVNGVVYYRMSILGDLSKIPTRIARKTASPRKQVKNALRTGFSVVPKGVGAYCGFELDGDGRFLLGDFTVTHNTKLAAAIVDGARSKGNRIAFVVPAIDLIDQTVESFYAEGLTDVGVIQADHQMTDWSKPIQVCSIQTIGRRGRPEASIVVVDECFVAGTIVDTPFGGKPIESVCVGDFVYNATGIGVVRHKFERRALSVVYLSLSNGEAILVTANHPLFTGRGWVKAGDLEVGSRLFSREAVRALRKSVQALGGGVARSARMPSGIGLEQANTLLNILLQESEQPNGGSRSPREDERDPAKDWAYADQTRRERKGERSAGCSLASAGEWMDFGIRGEDVKFGERIPDLLQDRHCQSGANGWDRSGREYALRKGKGTRQEENEFVGDVWVEDIARFERRSGAHVYNLEVSGHPSYFAGGVLAHNCHKLFQAQKDWITDPLCEKVIFIGLSATPWTKGLGKFYDTLIVAETTQGLIEKGFLSRFKAFATGHPDLTGVKTVAGDYHEGQLSEAMQQGTLVADIIDTYKTRWGKGKTLVFGVDCTHAKCLQERFNQAGIPAGYQDAFTSMDERREIKRKFHNGDFQVVCNVGTLCLDEQTEILTSDGWTGIEAMTMQHKIAAWAEDGVEFTHPLGIVRRWREPHERMVSVAGRVHNIRVTANHRMQWSTHPWNFCIHPAEDLVGKRGYIPVTGKAPPAVFEFVGPHFEHQTKKRVALAYKYRKEGIAPGEARSLSAAHVDYQNKNLLRMPHELTLDDCAFIGFWLGDGSRSTGASDKISFAQSERNSGVIRWIDALIERMGLHVNRRRIEPDRKSKNWSIRWEFAWGRGGREQRRDGGLSYLDDYLNKDGTPLYWGLDEDQFAELLHGYWMADGNHGADGLGSGNGKQISGTNRKIFDLLQAIGACRGVRISVRCGRNARGNHAPLYFMTYLEQSASCLMRERLAFEEDFRDERVWCVTSTTGNLITRRAGKVAIVGNTTGVDWDVRCLVLARPTKSEMLYVQIIGRALRTNPEKEYALILDHSDTTSRLGLVTDIHHDQLDDGLPKQKAEKKKPLPKECKECGYLKPAGVGLCPNCGHQPKPPKNGRFEDDGELVEIDPAKAKRAVARANGVADWTMGQKQTFFSELITFAGERGFKPGWAARKYKDRMGVWPNQLIKEPAAYVSGPTRKWLNEEYRRWKEQRDASFGAHPV